MVLPAAITPFTDSGQVDYVQMTKLIAWFKSNEVDGYVAAGTTGEGPSLSGPEKRDLIRHCTKHSYGLKVILGIATNSLTEAKWLCRQAAEEGAYAVLVMPPWFFKEGGDEGFRAWFMELMDSSDVPVLAYNFPQRIGVRLSVGLIESLKNHERFIGLKDSSGEHANLAGYAAVAGDKTLLVGDETLLLEALNNGWSGTISGASNVIGRWLKAVCEDYKTDKESAEVKFQLVHNALEAIRKAPQPLSHKLTLEKIGVLDNAAVRLPLQRIETEATKTAVEQVLRLIGE